MLKKTYLALSIIIVLIVAVVAVFYLLSSPQVASPTVTVGVKVGDVFTYQLKGSVDSHKDVPMPDNFADVNNVDYYRVEITNVVSPIVSYTATLQFKNGTKHDFDYKVNLENGLYSGHPQYLWEIYPSNLSEGSLSYPGYEESPIISETQLNSYPDGYREINFIHTESEWYDSTDLTYTKWFLEHNYIHFDKQTGMIVEFKSMQIYNSPEIILTIEYKLVSSNAIKVS
jgi:hypothetical protein